jgi:hypothetical protein
LSALDDILAGTPPINREAKPSVSATDKAETTGKTDTPPKRGYQRKPKDESSPRPEPVKQRASLEEKLTDFLGTASIPFALAGDQYCAQIIATRTPPLATALAELARENKGVDRVLRRMLEGSAWGGVALAVVSIVVPIAQHHGALPGADPFSMMYPPFPAQAEVAMQWTAPPATENGQPAAQAQAPSNGRPDVPDEYKTTIPGAPPGVVTVAATNAGHR